MPWQTTQSARCQSTESLAHRNLVSSLVMSGMRNEALQFFPLLPFTMCYLFSLSLLSLPASLSLSLSSNSGTHHHKSCNEQEQARIANDKLNAQKASFFPASISIDPGTNPAAPRRKPKNYGGWGDVRDHRLCLSFVQR